METVKQKLSEHFSRQEFVCRCGACESIDPNPRLIEDLETLRDVLGCPIHIISGYRCYSHNKDIGGKPNSQHLKGNAADIVCMRVMPADVADAIDKLWPRSHGLGRYLTFTHFDVREQCARWWN